MSEYKFGIGDFLTRDGHKAVVLCDDAPGPWPFIGYVILDNGIALARAWERKGSLYSTRDDEHDLMPPAPPKPEPVECWVNLYSHPERATGGIVYTNQSVAAADVAAWESWGWTLLRTIRISSEDTDRYAEGWDAAIEAALHALECAGFDADGIAQPAVAYLKGKANA